MMKNTIYIAPENLGDFFKTELANPKAVFIFPTDVVMNSWIDWCVTNPEKSGVDAVPLERFTAWDKFKAQFIKAKEEGKSSIPSILRKFFVSSLISQNANELFFNKIINPQFANQAQSFTSWISKMLPSLQLWKNYIDANPDYKMDAEDSDFLELYNRYSSFLEKNQLFEPSWIQPDFSDEGNKYIIFYPEILEDYADYIEIFAKCTSITLVSLPEIEAGSGFATVPCHKFSDARKELRRTILQIRHLVAEKKADWNKITLSVPDLQTYRPYLERELSKYCIPFVIRAGFPLTNNCAGQIFTEIQNCKTSEFSYESMRSLLLDEYIPWKEEFSELRKNLIREGNRLRCICGFTETAKDGNSFHFDSWEKALSSISEDVRELEFYKSLKNDITKICEASSFDGIHAAWLIFREKYLESSEFSQTANNIISRCITELNKLNEIELNFCNELNPELSIQNHYEFFMTELNGKTYTPQNTKTGIAVYPYRLSAAANFKYQFIIDANQRNLEIQYKRLGFLNAEKRRALGLENDDKKYNASKPFIRLYAKQSDKEIIQFSYSENSFGGFAISHNALEIPKNQKGKEIENPLSQLDSEDFILSEKNYLLGKTDCKASELKLSKAQKTQLTYWQFFNTSTEEDKTYSESEALKTKVQEILVENRNKHTTEEEKDGKLILTQSDMKNFFPCPRKWIFSNVLKLKEESLDTNLMQIFDMGTINHQILESFMKSCMETNTPLPVTNEENSFENEEEIRGLINKFANDAISDRNKDYALSPLTQKMLSAQIDDIVLNIMSFLHSFCQKNASIEKINTKTKTQGYGGCIVRGVEKSLSAKNPEASFNYFGKIDLLLSSGAENTSDIGWVIIDYKNTSVPANADIKLKDDGTLGDFQMPMYINLVRKNEKVQDIDVARFYSIKTAESHCAIDINTKDRAQENFEPELKAFEEYASSFASDIENGKLEPLVEKIDIYNDCLKCSFKAVCRFNYVIAGRKM